MGLRTAGWRLERIIYVETQSEGINEGFHRSEKASEQGSVSIMTEFCSQIFDRFTPEVALYGLDRRTLRDADKRVISEKYKSRQVRNMMLRLGAVEVCQAQIWGWAREYNYCRRIELKRIREEQESRKAAAIAAVSSSTAAPTFIHSIIRHLWKLSALAF